MRSENKLWAGLFALVMVLAMGAGDGKRRRKTGSEVSGEDIGRCEGACFSGNQGRVARIRHLPRGRQHSRRAQEGGRGKTVGLAGSIL